MIYNERTMKKLLVSGAPPFIFQESKIEVTPRIIEMKKLLFRKL